MGNYGDSIKIQVQGDKNYIAGFFNPRTGMEEVHFQNIRLNEYETNEYTLPEIPNDEDWLFFLK
jgi:hypothetical protein